MVEVVMMGGRQGGLEGVDEVNQNLQKSDNKRKQTNKRIKIKYKQNKILKIKIIIITTILTKI